MGERLDTAKNLYLRAIRDGDYVNAIHAHSGQRYTQHSTPVRDGREGFIEFFADFVERNPVRDIEIVRGFEDGRYVFVHVLQTLNHGEFQYVTADIFDTDDDAKLIEHWDIISEMRGSTPSGRTQIDGPTEPTGLHLTEASKRLVTSFVEEVLMTGDLDRMVEFMDPHLAQHAPDIADGAAAFTKFAAARSLRYVEIHRVVGSGNFVAVLAERHLGGKSQAVIDLYRVADGKIVESWSVVEDIAPKESWVNSGKF